MSPAMTKAGRPLAVALLLLCAAPGAVSAAELVLAAPGGSDIQQVERDFWRRTGHRDVVVVRPSDVVASFEPFVLLGVEPTPCTGDPSDDPSVDAMVSEAAGALNYVEYGPAEDALNGAWAALPCLSGRLSPETLSRLYFFRGLTSFYQQGDDVSRREFRQGLLVSPFLQWDPTYPPDAHPVFEAALNDALQAGEGLLELSRPLFAEAEVRVDGLQIDQRTRTRPMFEGMHLLQIVRGDDTRTFFFELEAGGAAELLRRDDLASALHSGEAGPLARATLAAELGARGGQVGSNIIWVERPGSPTVFDRYFPAEDRWERADARAVADRIRRGRRLQALGVGAIAFGVATTVVGGVVALQSLQDAQTLGDAIDEQLAYHDAQGDWDSVTRDSVDALFAQHDDKRRLHTLGLVLGGVGLGVTVAGVIPTHLGTVQVRGRQAPLDGGDP